MKDIEFYPTEDIIKELMKRSESFLLLLEMQVEGNPEELEYEHFHKGDKEWMLKRLEREIIPMIKDEIDEEEVGDA
jgi:hypothetical protein